MQHPLGFRLIPLPSTFTSFKTKRFLKMLVSGLLFSTLASMLFSFQVLASSYCYVQTIDLNEYGIDDLAWDGTRLLILYHGWPSDKVGFFDMTGNLENSLDTLTAYATGITFTGNEIIFGREGNLYRMNPLTGNVSGPVAATYFQPYLAFDGAKILSSGPASGSNGILTIPITMIDSSSYQDSGTINVTVDTGTTASGISRSVIACHKGNLFVALSIGGTNNVFEFDKTLNLVQEIPIVQIGGGQAVKAITFVGDDLLVANYSENEIYRYSPCFRGDVTNDGKIDLQDIIVALQSLAGIPVPVSLVGDANGDNLVGIPEVLYVLQCLTGLRNHHPELAPIGNKLVDEGATLSFTISGSDPDGDSLNYSSSNLPVGAIFNADTKTFFWTPTYSQSGTYDVTFTVADIQGASDSETIAITVNAVMCVEYWHYTLDGGQGSGDLALAEQQGENITVDGSWAYNYSGAIATGPFTDGAATIEGTAASFIATGTATHPYAPSSPFTMNVSLITNNGQASGTYTMTFSNPTWPPMLSGNVVGTRTSGSGITQ